MVFSGLADFGSYLTWSYRVEKKAAQACGLKARWSQRRLPLEFMDGLNYTTIIEPAEPLARRRGSALGR